MQPRAKGEMEDKQFKVVIAGGGVAAVEAALALRELRRTGLELELIAPNDELILPALAVAEPFGITPPPAIPLADVCGTSARRIAGTPSAASTPGARIASHRVWSRGPLRRAPARDRCVH